MRMIRVLMLGAAVATTGCIADGEPRKRTLAEFQATYQHDSAPIRDERYRRQGEIARDGDDYVIRDEQYRTQYRLDRQSDGSYAIRDDRYRRLGTISAPDASGTRRVRDDRYLSKGTIREGDDGSTFLDSQHRRRLETDLRLED